MNTIFKASALAAACASLSTVAPASAAVQYSNSTVSHVSPGAETAYNQYRDYRGDYRRGYRDDNRRGYRRSYDEPVYRSTRTWRGNDGRYYCRKKNGTTGLIIGGAAGALLGRSIDGGRDRTLGTLLGAAGGALLGREVDRGGSRCR